MSVGAVAGVPRWWRATAREYQYGAREAYAGEDGYFLGRHRRKVYGYLAVAFTVGRDMTIGGFAGPPQSRRWNDVDRELRVSRAERLHDPTLPQDSNTAEKQVTTDSPRDARRWLLGEVTIAELARTQRPRSTAGGLPWTAPSTTSPGFLSPAPGGVPILQAHAGLDATAAFPPGPPGLSQLHSSYGAGTP